MFDYTNPGTWKEAGLLPAARSGLKGVSIGQDFFVTGGETSNSLSWWKDEIPSWDPITKSWTVAGHLLFERSDHGVAEVVFAKHCVRSRAAGNSVMQVLVVLSFIGNVLIVAA